MTSVQHQKNSPLTNINFISHVMKFVKPFGKEDSASQILLGNFCSFAYVCSSWREYILFYSSTNAVVQNSRHFEKVFAFALSKSIASLAITCARMGSTSIVIDSSETLEQILKILHPHETIVGKNVKMISGSIAAHDDDGVAKIVRVFPFLTTLFLNRCSGLTDVGVEHICKLVDLEVLSLESCSKISPSGLQKLLSSLPRLKKLYLSNCKLKEAHLIQFSKAAPTSLQVLHLCGNVKIFDEHIAHLSGLLNLEDISFWECPNISEVGLKHLIHLPRLDPENVTTIFSGVSAEGFDEFAKELLSNQSKK